MYLGFATFQKLNPTFRIIFGGDRRYRTDLDIFLARENRSPLLPPNIIVKCYLPICQNVANTDKRIAVILGPVPRTVRPA
jgi:hypothetical protein